MEGSKIKKLDKAKPKTELDKSFDLYHIITNDNIRNRSQGISRVNIILPYGYFHEDYANAAHVIEHIIVKKLSHELGGPERYYLSAITTFPFSAYDFRLTKYSNTELINLFLRVLDGLSPEDVSMLYKRAVNIGPGYSVMDIIKEEIIETALNYPRDLFEAANVRVKSPYLGLLERINRALPSENKLESTFNESLLFNIKGFSDNKKKIEEIIDKELKNLRENLVKYGMIVISNHKEPYVPNHVVGELEPRYQELTINNRDDYSIGIDLILKKILKKQGTETNVSEIGLIDILSPKIEFNNFYKLYEIPIELFEKGKDKLSYGFVYSFIVPNYGIYSRFLSDVYLHAIVRSLWFGTKNNIMSQRKFAIGNLTTYKIFTRQPVEYCVERVCKVSEQIQQLDRGLFNDENLRLLFDALYTNDINNIIPRLIYGNFMYIIEGIGKDAIDGKCEERLRDSIKVLPYVKKRSYIGAKEKELIVETMNGLISRSLF